MELIRAESSSMVAVPSGIGICVTPILERLEKRSDQNHCLVRQGHFA